MISDEKVTGRGQNSKMAKSSTATILLVLLFSIASSAVVSAFAPRAQIRSRQDSFSSRVCAASAKLDSSTGNNDAAVEPTYSPIPFDGTISSSITVGQQQRPACKGFGATLPSIGGAATGLLAYASTAVADYYTDGAEDDLEIESLPPPWVPIIFAIVIIGGVGVLTSSLGDVMYDGKFSFQKLIHSAFRGVLRWSNALKFVQMIQFSRLLTPRRPTKRFFVT